MMRAPKRTLAATMLVLEAMSVFFAALVAMRVSADLDMGRSLAVIGGLALACLVTAGLLRWRLGYVIGSLLQVPVIATGLWVPTMYFVGGVFAVLWALALKVGGRVEREQAERERAGRARTEGVDDVTSREPDGDRPPG